MPTEAEEIWSRLLARARSTVSDDVMRTWLDPIVAVSWQDPTLTLSLPDQFSLDWTESKYSELLSSLAPIALGHPVILTFTVDLDRRQRQQIDLFTESSKDNLKTLHKDTIAPLLNDRYTFEHFVVGKSNELAAAAAHAVTEAPGHVYNPFFIYGRTGLGKTHLMQAIGHEILQQRPGSRIIYISTEQFTNEMVASIQTRRNFQFRQRFRETDVLLVDDIHFLKGKESTQEEFFHTFNALYEAGRQIVLTSDRPPAEIGGLEARLISRFQWGMVADIEPPDVEHRIAILQHKAELDHLQLTFPSDVLEFIAQSVNSSVRELEGSIIKILAYASLRHRPIDLLLAQEALHTTAVSIGPNGVEKLQQQPITVLTIQRAVAAAWDVTPEGLCSKARVQRLTIPRQLAMYLTRSALGLQLTEIGIAFGGRDHSTVIHSLNRATALLETDETISTRYKSVLRGLGLISSESSGKNPLLPETNTPDYK